MHPVISERHPKPGEGLIPGSQPSGDLLASSLAEGLAVAPGAERSDPAANETDDELTRLRTDVSRDRKRIAGMIQAIERRGEALRSKARRLVELETARERCIEAAA